MNKQSPLWEAFSEYKTVVYLHTNKQALSVSSNRTGCTAIVPLPLSPDRVKRLSGSCVADTVCAAIMSMLTKTKQTSIHFHQVHSFDVNTFHFLLFLLKFRVHGNIF